MDNNNGCCAFHDAVGIEAAQRPWDCAAAYGRRGRFFYEAKVLGIMFNFSFIYDVISCHRTKNYALYLGDATNVPINVSQVGQLRHEISAEPSLFGRLILYASERASLIVKCSNLTFFSSVLYHRCRIDQKMYKMIQYCIIVPQRVTTRVKSTLRKWSH
jgi:hypothetical protein